MSFVPAGAALLGLAAGPYVRVLASGFGPAPEAAEDAGPGAPHAGADGVQRAVEARAAYRVEARRAFGRAARSVPRFGRPPLAEGCTAAVCALVAWRIQGAPLLAAWLYAAITGCALAMIDWRTQRLPDAITLPSYPILAILLTLAGRLQAGLLGALALAGIYAMLWLLRPGALGLGDVKLAGLVGMLTGALGLDAWLTAAVAGQFLGALYAVILLITRRTTLKGQIPLGPFILLGALAAVLH